MSEELLKQRSPDSIYLPSKTTTVKVSKEAHIQLTEHERIEYAESLKEAQANLADLEREFADLKREYKAKLEAAKADFNRTLRAVAHGELIEADAECELVWTPHKNEITISYLGRTLERRPPQKSDEALFESLFPENEPAKKIN